MSKLSSLFEESERFIDFSEIETGKLLDQNGVVSCSKTLNALDIDRRKAFAMLRKEAHAYGNEEDYFARYGLKKYGTSRWYVHMPTFRGFVSEFKRRFPIIKKTKTQRIKPGIDREHFFALDGPFLYREVMAEGFLPFDPDQLLRQITTKGLRREICGVWKEGAEFLVDFRVFLTYAYALKANITIDEARTIVDKMSV